MKKLLMKSVSGIRGIVGKSLTPEIVLQYSSAFGIMSNRGKIVVGRDTRVSGEMLEKAVFSGLMSVGCNVINLGICPSPTVQFMVEKQKTKGGISITASHNPIEWNALKFIGRDGLFLDEKEWEKLDNIYEKKRIRYVDWKNVGRIVDYDSVIEEHVEKILDLPYLSPDRIAQRKFQVVVDCVNGAGWKIVPYLLEKLGCSVYPLNCDKSGIFPHDPEPLPENLTELCEKVKLYGADIGFAVDPDGDRLAVVDENGVPLGEDYTLVLAVKYILEKKKGDVVVNETTSRAVDDIASEFGVRVERTKVGEIYVAQKMRELGSPIGGEGNGGVILPEVHLGRDAMVGISIIIQMLAEYNTSIGKLRKELPDYCMVKRKIQLSDDVYNKLIKKLSRENSKEDLSLIDGLKINKKDWWIHIRKSRTEPAVRVVCEAKSKKKVEEIYKGIEKIISDISKEVS